MTNDQYAPALTYSHSRPTNVLAIIALIASCLGFTVPGIIMGHIALHQIKTTGEGGHGLALAGVIVGYCLLVLTILLIVFYVLIIVGLIAWATANSSNFSNFG